MPQARDEAGNIWETDAQGNPIALVQAAGAAGQVMRLPQSPEQAAKDARQAQQDAVNAQDKAADNARADRSLELQEEMASLNAEVKRIQIEKARGGGNTAANRDRVSRLNQLVRQINRVQTLYDDNIGTTKGITGLADYLPTNENARFDAAGAALSQQGLAAFRVPGTGTISDRDAIMFDRANLPTAATRDAAIEEQLLGLRSRVEEELSSLGRPLPQWGEGQRAEDETDKAAAFVDPGNPDLPPANEGGNAPETPWAARLGTDGPGQTAASGDYRRERDDRVSAQVDALINAGAGEATINATLKAKGFAPLPLGSLEAARVWMRQNPGQSYFGANAQREVPLNIGQRIAGSPAGAFTAQMTNAATAGTVGALAGDRGRGALDAMATMNPNASLAGSLVGGVTGALGAEAALAARAPLALARFAPRAADAAYGGLFGFNTAEDGAGAEGALTGALTGAIGGAVGERALRAVGSATKGVTNPAVQYLRDRGVPLTVGQSVEGSGMIGRTIKGVEDRLAGLPLVGDIVNARRTEGLEAFNRAAFGDAGAPIGANPANIGREGVDELLDTVGRSYDEATAGVRVPLDERFAEDFAQVGAAGESLPDDLRSRFGLALNNRVGPIADAGELTGDSYQQAMRGLKSYKAENVKPGFEQDYRDALTLAQDTLRGQMNRGGGESVVEGLGRADNAYRNIKTIEDAIGRADGTGYMFTPSQLQDAAKKTAKRFPGDRALYDLADNAQSVLPSRVPDSGTAGRIATGVALGGVAGGLGGAGVGGMEGAGAGTGLGLGATLALALFGSKAGQNALTGTLLNRPAIARAVGDAIQRRSQLGGGFGAGVLTPLTVGNQ